MIDQDFLKKIPNPRKITKQEIINIYLDMVDLFVKQQMLHEINKDSLAKQEQFSRLSDAEQELMSRTKR